MRGDARRGRRLGQPGRMAAGGSPRRLAVSVVVGMVASLAVVVGPVPPGGEQAAAQVPPPAPPPSTYCDNIEPDGLAPADAGVVDPTDNPGGGSAVDVTVEVADVETGAAVTEFSYMVSLDNTARGADPEPARHPALHHMASQSPNVGAGDQDNATFTVPDGCRYLISVRAPGYKLWGQHLELPGPDPADPRTVTVELLADAQPADTVPNPQTGAATPREGLPTSDLRVLVFEDVRSTNGEPDVPFGTDPNPPPDDPLRIEGPLAGFHVVVRDTLGEVVVDIGGSPLCQDTGNDCITDDNGELLISGLPFGKYEVTVVPPDGTDWTQTTTFEGTHTVDAWLEEGTDGRGAPGEFRIEPAVMTAYWFGFVSPEKYSLAPSPDDGTIVGRAVNFMVTPPFENSAPQPNEPVHRPMVALNDLAAADNVVAVVEGDADGNFQFDNVPPGTYLLTIWDVPQDYILARYNITVGANQTVDLNDIGVFRWFGWMSGFVYLDNGLARDGTPITDANAIQQLGPDGTPLPAGTPFARNGVRDCYDPDGAAPFTADPFAYGTCETGLVGEEVLLKLRDGSVKAGTVTDGNGWYELPEARGPLNRYMVSEVGAGRRQWTGHSLHQEFNFDPAAPPNPAWDPYLSTRLPGDAGGDLLLSSLLIEGHRSWVDWGKDNRNPLDPENDDNGGIAGAVLYGTTRNEFSPRFAAQEDYEPGIGGVPVRLWGTSGTPTDQSDDVLLTEVASDAWAHPTDPGNDDPNTVCTVLDNLGNPVPGPTPQMVSERCLEVPLNGNETQDGLWDGGWAIEDDCSAAVSALHGGPIIGDEDDDFDDVPNRDEPLGELIPGGLTALEEYIEANPDACTHVVNDQYVVEVQPPPFFQLLKEEDQNTDEGDIIVPAIPPPPCVGELHTVVDPRNPADGTATPLCDRKLVTVQAGQNAAAEFTLFTECEACAVDNEETGQRWSTDPEGPSDESVPLPARFFGLVEDDVTVNADENSIAYGEKRGVANLPIGIYDFTGRLLTTIYTDQDGYYEVLLPSSYTALCPIPSGVCPGMYILRMNDPGSVSEPNPSYRTNYLTEPFVFDAWPGKMTHTDTPVDPISTLVCTVPEQAPEILAVSDVWKTPSETKTITVTGTEFEHGASGKPTVTLTNDATGVVTTIPAASVVLTPSNPSGDPPFEDVLAVTVGPLAAGTYQLAVTADGSTTRTGLTFHVRRRRPRRDGRPAGQRRRLRDHPGRHRRCRTRRLHRRAARHVPRGGHHAPAGHPPGPRPRGRGRPARARRRRRRPHHQRLPLRARPRHGDRRALLRRRRRHAGGLGRDPRLGRGPGRARPSSRRERASAWWPAARASSTGRTHRSSTASASPRPAASAAAGSTSTPTSTGSPSATTSSTATPGVFGGALAVGLPGVGGGIADAQNDDLRVHHNRIVGNGGSFTAGAVGVFAGAENYRIDHNDVCGNYGLEYGGGISHWGQSAGGRIQDNLVYYNDSIDSGGGITVAGDNTYTGGSLLGNGTGDDIVVERNTIEFNNSDDDGGGVFLLRPLEDTVLLQNNFINNNLAQDFGGGIALDDAADAFIINNTVAYNVSTSTAEDADRSSCFPGGAPPPGNPLYSCPHAAGIASELHSEGLFTPDDGSTFSDPVMFNNIIYQNEAYFWGATTEGARRSTAPCSPESSTSRSSTAACPATASTPASRSSRSTTDRTTPIAPPPTRATTSASTRSSSRAGSRTRGTPGSRPRPTASTRSSSTCRSSATSRWQASAASPSCSTTTSSPTPRPSTPASTSIRPAAARPHRSTTPTAMCDPNRRGRPTSTREPTRCRLSPSVRLDLSLEATQSLPVGGGTVTVADEDVLTWDGTGFTMLFDGSDELGFFTSLLTDLDAFAALGPNQFLVSFDIPVLGPVLGLPLVERPPDRRRRRPPVHGHIVRPDDGGHVVALPRRLGRRARRGQCRRGHRRRRRPPDRQAADLDDGFVVGAGCLLRRRGPRRLHRHDHRPGHHGHVGEVLRRERRRPDHRRGERRRDRGGPGHPRHPLLHQRRVRRDRGPGARRAGGAQRRRRGRLHLPAAGAPSQHTHRVQLGIRPVLRREPVRPRPE